MASDNNIHEHHHHHHHHHHSMDASEEFKRRQFRSQKIKKALSKVNDGDTHNCGNMRCVGCILCLHQLTIIQGIRFKGSLLSGGNCRLRNLYA